MRPNTSTSAESATSGTDEARLIPPNDVTALPEGNEVRANTRSHPVDDAPRGAAADRLLAVGAMSSASMRDLRNVLCAVIGFAQLLQDELAPGSPAGVYARQIASAGTYGTAMADRLLAYVERGPAGRGRVDLRGVVDSTVELVRHLIGRHIRLTVHHAAGDLPVVGDPCELEQVVLTLVLNARDAMPAGGHLILTTRRSTGPGAASGDADVPWALLSVHDTGVPLAPDAIESSAEDLRPILNLATLKGLVLRNGGMLRVAPPGEEGNSFEVYLPAAP